MSSKIGKDTGIINTASRNQLIIAMEKLNPSACEHDRILKVSCTIADLAGTTDIKSVYLAEDSQCRTLEREGRDGIT